MVAAMPEPNPAIHVLVVDKQAVIRAAVRKVVDATPGFVTAGSVTRGEDALEILPGVGAQLVLMDVDLPGLGGIETARLMKKRHPEVVVVLLSAGVSADFGGATAFRQVIVDKRLLSPTLLRQVWEQGRPNGLRSTGA
jgi:DNA-binding NarL/FixJ family response regulator